MISIKVTMGEKLKIMTFAFFLLISNIVLGQNLNDTLDTEIDSLLKIVVAKPEYISAASKYSQLISESPLSSSLISINSIKSFKYHTINEALSSQADIYTSDDLSYGSIGIRGFCIPSDYNNRIVALLDGHVLNERFYGSVNLLEMNLDPNMFDNIEVIKGPGSLTYGTNAMFGIIAMNSLNPESNSLPRISLTLGYPGSTSFNFHYSYDLFKDFNFQLFSGYRSVDGGNIYFPEYDSPETNNGIAENINGETSYNIYNKIKYNSFTFSGLFTSRKKEIPTASYGTLFNKNENILDERGYLDIKKEINLSYDKIIIPRIYYDYYRYHGNFQYDQTNGQDFNVMEMLGAEIQFMWDILQNLRITSGAEYRHSLNAEYKFFDDEKTIISFNERNDEFSIYLLGEYNPFNFISIYGGIRYDDYFNIDNQISPRISLLFYPSKNHILKYIYGKSFRIPTLYEKYYEDPYENFKRSNGLKSESVNTYELVYDYNAIKETKLSFSVYFNQINDLINVVTDPVDSMEFYSNVDSYKGIGFSVSIDANISKSISIYSNYSFQRIHPLNSNDLVNSPQHLLKFGLVWKLSEKMTSSFEYRYESSRKAYNMSKTPDVNIVNINLDWTPIQDITISFSVRNLFDNIIKSPVGLEHLQFMVPNPGRALFLKIGWGL